MHCKHNDQQNPRFVGDPVDVVTGVMTDMRPDFLPRSQLNIQWFRYYSSDQTHRIGPLGRGFRHQFEHLLTRDLDGLRYQGPDGKVAEYPELISGEACDNSGTRLQRISETDYLLVRGSDRLSFSFKLNTQHGLLDHAELDFGSISFKYDPESFRLVLISDESRTVRVNWNSNGRLDELILLKQNSNLAAQVLIKYEYDSSENLIRATDFYGGLQLFEYDASHRMTKRTDRRGYSFLFEYDLQGRCIRSRGEDGLLDVQLDYRPEARTTYVQHASGGRWIYFYDRFGNVTQVTDPYGFATKYQIDELGNTVAEIDPQGNKTQHHYDWLGEHDYCVAPTGEQLPTREDDDDPDDDGSDELPETLAQWELGALAPTTDEESGQADALISDFPSSVFNQFAGVFEYDNSDSDVTSKPPLVNQEVIPREAVPFDETLLPFTRQSEFDKNGNLIRYQDRDGKSYRYTYQSWNLPFEEIDPLGNTNRFYYGSNVELNRVVDAGGTEHKFVYDLKDRLSAVYYGGKLQETLKYDSADNLIEKRDGQGNLLAQWEIGTNNLDKSQRLSNGEVHHFEYDPHGKITKAAWSQGLVSCAHNELNQLKSDTRDGLGITHEYRDGSVSSSTYLSKFSVKYETDDDGSLVIRDPTGSTQKITFGPNGRHSRRLANGSRELIQYDSDGRCQHKALVDSSGKIWRRSFSYSAEGDLTRVDDNQLGKTGFYYDDAHRLRTEVRHNESYTYEYDIAGNLVKQPGLADVSIVNGNRLTSANDETFEYDHRDNLVRRHGKAKETRYTYDSLDQLIGCDINGQEWSASYDPLGRRISKTWLGKTTKFFWDDYRLSAEIKHDGTVRIYIYTDIEALVPFMFVEYASLECNPEDGKRFYIYTNQVGSPVRVDDDAGHTVWQARINAYGAAEISIGSQFHMPIRFPGHYYDQETGLHYNRFRYYDPQLGRYIQLDPLGIEGGINLFAYVDNPLIEVDIDGLKKKGGCPPKSNSKKKRQARPKSKSATKPSPKPKKKAPAKPRMPNVKKWKKKGGKVVMHKNGERTYTDKRGNSVKYNKKGYPNFAPHAVKSVPISPMKGNHSSDFTAANKAAGIDSDEWKKLKKTHTWHHHEDGKTMQLVPKKVHNNFPHTGGVSKVKNS